MKKRLLPKTSYKRKFIKSLFWIGFISVIFLSIVAIGRAINVGANQEKLKKETMEIVNSSLVSSVSAQTFAENFATQYFQWDNSVAGSENRESRLKPYLIEGLDPQAGLVLESVQANSNVVKAKSWSVVQTGKNQANITVFVQHSLSGKMKGVYDKYFVVPIETDGNSFIVNQIPYLAANPEKPLLKLKDRESLETINDPALENEIITFLNSFFKNYSTGTIEEIAYFTKDESIKPLTGIVTFNSLKNVEIVQNDWANQFTITADVEFKENHSKASMIYPYKLEILKENGRFFVKELLNQ